MYILDIWPNIRLNSGYPALYIHPHYTCIESNNWYSKIKLGCCSKDNEAVNVVYRAKYPAVFRISGLRYPTSLYTH